MEQINIALVNPEAEAATLGSMLLDKEAIDEVLKILKVGDFYREKDNWIFEAIIELDNSGAGSDFVALTDLLSRKKYLDQIGIDYIAGLSNATPTHIYASHYAKIVKKFSIHRRLAAAAQKMAALAYSTDGEIDDLLAQADAELTKVIESSIAEDKTRSLAELSKLEVQRIDDAGQRVAQGLPATDDLYTDLVTLNRFLHGFEKQRLYIIAGRPGMGKSAVAMQICYGFAKGGSEVLVFSLEMSAEQMQRRLLSQETAIEVQRLREAELDDAEWLVLMEATDKLTRIPLSINDDAGLTITKLRSIARRHRKVKGSLDCIMIDYMQLMNADGKGDNRNTELSTISRGLKLLARELNCVVICLSQLNRAVEGRAEKRPQLSDLKDSGAIEQDADVVDFVYREDYYDEDSERQNILEYIRSKGRDCPLGTVSLYFRKELTKISDLEIQRTELEY